MKYKVGESVYINDGESEKYLATVIAREETPTEGKQYKVEYLVKPDGANDISEYKIVTRKQMSKPKNDAVSTRKVLKKIYNLSFGFNLTVVAIADYVDRSFTNSSDEEIIVKKNEFSLGYAICSPEDEFNEKVGFKLARHRAKKHPFCFMISDKKAEFDEETMMAIMDVKAQYIDEHLARYIGFLKIFDK